MNAAVSKLRKDFWKNEHPEEEETEKEIETVNNKDTDNELQQKDGQVDAEKTTEVQVAQTETVQFKSKQLKKRQTDVSKIRRSIFKLPVSSPYTQYYPPEEGDVQAESPLSDQGGTTKGSSLSSAARDKTKGKIEQNDQSNPADKSKPDDQPDAIAKNPRSKALARRQSSNNELTTESEQNTKENKDRQSSDQQKDKLTAGPRGYGEKRELRRMKGHFFCDKCQKRWMSLHVYCEPGTKKVVYGQICDTCKTEQMPKRVTRIRCVTCEQFDCDCEMKRARHIEPRMMHRPDLCVKCLSGDLCS